MLWINKLSRIWISKWMIFSKRIVNPIEKVYKSKGSHKVAMSVVAAGSYTFLNQQTFAVTGEYLNKHNVLQEPNKHVKKQNIFQLISEDLDKIDFVKGKEIVLIMGIEGAGKSTLVNYLLGCNMKKNNEKMEVDGRVMAAIGHDVLTFKSKTLHLEIYEHHNRVYIDCPGLNKLTSEIREKLVMQLMLKKAKGVKILLVIDQSNILTLEAWSQIYKSLDLLFKGVSHVNLTHALSLVVTKTDKLRKPSEQKKIADDIQACIDAIEEEVKELNEKNNITLHGLKLIDKGKIIIADLLDKKKKTELEINNKLDLSTPLRNFAFESSFLLKVGARDITFKDWIYDAVINVDRLFVEQQALCDNRYEGVSLEDSRIVEIGLEIEKHKAEIEKLAAISEESIVLEVYSFKEAPWSWMHVLSRESYEKVHKEPPFTGISVTKNDGSEFVEGRFLGDGYVGVRPKCEHSEEYVIIYTPSYFHDADACIKLVGKAKYSKEYLEQRNNYDNQLITKEKKLEQMKHEQAQQSLANVTTEIEQSWNIVFAIREMINLLDDNEKSDSRIVSFCEKLCKPTIFCLHANQLHKMGYHAEALKSYGWAEAKMGDMHNKEYLSILHEQIANSLLALRCLKEAYDYYKRASQGVSPTKKQRVDKQQLQNSQLMRTIKLTYFDSFGSEIRGMISSKEHLSRFSDQVNPDVWDQLKNCTIENEALIIPANNELSIIQLKFCLEKTKHDKFRIGNPTPSDTLCLRKAVGGGAFVFACSTGLSRGLCFFPLRESLGLGTLIGAVTGGVVYKKCEKQSQQTKKPRL